MKIQEVSERTGLSDKTIRYYESIGLLEVARKENGYREYTEESVKTLNVIRLLRYLAFSLEDIKSVLDNPDLWDSKYRDLADELSEEGEHLYRKKILIQSIEDESFSQLKESSEDLLNELGDEELLKYIEHLEYPSLFTTILRSATISAPIFWLLLITYLPDPFEVFNNGALVPLAIASTVVNTLLWRHYLVNRNKYLKRSSRASKINRANTLNSLLMVIVAVVSSIAILAGVSFLQQVLFKRENVLMYVGNSHILNLLAIGVIASLFITVFFGLRYKYTKDLDFEEYSTTLKLIKRSKIILIINIVFWYVFITSVTLVKMDGSLVRFSPINLKGKHYSISDITGIKVGYSNTFMKQYKNDFYMKVSTKDFTIDIVDGSNTVEMGDTYSELEYLDDIYKKAGITKRRGNTSNKRCTLDKVYCDRFDRIIDLEN